MVVNGKTTIFTEERRVEDNSPSAALMWITGVNDSADVRLPRHPLETGMQVMDHKVIEPKTLRVNGWVARENSSKVDSLLESARVSHSLSDVIELSSPWKTYKKMYIKRFTSKASSEKYDVYDYVIELQEIFTAEKMTAISGNPDYAGPTNTGKSGGLS